MSERAPYSRLYWSVMDDDKFDGIRDDARLFGSWALLLVVADMAWPAPAYVPPTVSRSSMRRLVDCGLVDALPGHRFRLHGLDKERGLRSDAARIAAAVRWHPTSNADDMPSRDETRRDETRHGDAHADPEWLKAWFAIGRTRMPTPGQRAVIDSYLRAFDVTGDERLARVFLGKPDDPIGAAKEDLAAARQQWADEAAKAEPKPKVQRRGSGLPTSSRELLEHWAASAKPDSDA
jgi:hypothetical protein